MQEIIKKQIIVAASKAISQEIRMLTLSENGDSQTKIALLSSDLDSPVGVARYWADKYKRASEGSLFAIKAIQSLTLFWSKFDEHSGEAKQRDSILSRLEGIDPDAFKFISGLMAAASERHSI